MANQFSARLAELSELAGLREEYRAEMNCQIIHDSIHGRAGWTREYALELAGEVIGYGSVAVGGPWREIPTLYEFYVPPEQRGRIFEAFEALTALCGAETIETQSNDTLLTVMLHTYCADIKAESILFEDRVETRYRPAGAEVRRARPEEAEVLARLELDDSGWVLTVAGEIAGAGGVLYHYNPPYGDIYMEVAEPFRRKGLGAYLVQELKAACRAGGHEPAARCNVANLASRRTLQRAGFVPCGNLLTGKLGDGKSGSPASA